MEEKISLSSLSTAELGKHIVAAAQEERRKRFSAKVIAIADSEMESISVNEKRIEYHKACLELSKKKLAAIEAGEFTVNNRGVFQYNAKELFTPNEEAPIIELMNRITGKDVR